MDEMLYKKMDEITSTSSLFVRYKNKEEDTTEILIPFQMKYSWFHSFKEAIYTKYGPR